MKHERLSISYLMKKNLILSLIAVGLAGCYTADRTPYMGSMGEYGFTHDLNSSPSPFVDTSYRPLTAFDLAAPIIVVVTNRPPPRDIYQTAPETAVAGASGQALGTATTAAGTAPQINEAAGAQQSAIPPTAETNQPGLAATNNIIRDAAGTQRTNQFTNQLFNTNNLSPNLNTPPAPLVAPPPNPAPQSPPQGADPNQTQP